MDIPIDGDGSEPVPIKVYLGVQELHDRWADVVSALSEADLMAEARRFHGLVFEPAEGDIAKIFEFEEVDEKTIKLQYKPMIELLLCELMTAATAPGWSVQRRKNHIAEAMELAGY